MLIRAIVGPQRSRGRCVTTRLTALIIAVLDLVGWGLAGFNLLVADADPATRGLDQLGGYAITLLFVLTALPALVLAGLNRWPRAALGLSLAFPATFVVLLVAVAVTLP